MEVKQSLESIRDLAVDIFNAGRVAVTEWMARQDEDLADSINSDEE